MALPEKYRFYPFSSKARKLVSSMYPKPLSKQNLSLKITSMISKGILYRDEDNFIDYNPSIKKLLSNPEFNVTFTCRPTDK
jgi:hypothetical protein